MCPPRGLEVASHTLREAEVVVLVLRDAEQQAARELASTGGTSEPRLLTWTLHGPVRSKLRPRLTCARQYSTPNTPHWSKRSSRPSTPRGKPDNQLVAASNAYIAWGTDHPGAYQLPFESNDALPETRAVHGPRLQARIVELSRLVDPDAAFASALLLWSAWHGVVSLRLHKTEWGWGRSAQEANRRLVRALATKRARTPDPDRRTAL
ncbi:hypothetical protein GCM10009837_41860 [Streptomyces durmitorensis]